MAGCPAGRRLFCWTDGAIASIYDREKAQRIFARAALLAAIEE